MLTFLLLLAFLAERGTTREDCGLIGNADWLQSAVHNADNVIMGQVTGQVEQSLALEISQVLKGELEISAVILVTIENNMQICQDAVPVNQPKIFFLGDEAGVNQFSSSPLDATFANLAAVRNAVRGYNSLMAADSPVSDGDCDERTCHRAATCKRDSGGNSYCECSECSDQYSPVCGSDGITYANHCEMNKTACHINADIVAVSSGFCELPDPCTRRLQCSFGARCKSSENRISARCVCPTPDDCAGAPQETLCAEDGLDYPSPCHLNVSMCPLQRPINVKYHGSCDPCRKALASGRGPCGSGRGVCGVDGSRVARCMCGDLPECREMDDSLVCSSEWKTGTRCQLAYDACVNGGGRVSVIANSSCNQLKLRDACRDTRCYHFSSLNFTDSRSCPKCTCNFQCPPIYHPVCGRDSLGELRTYASECHARLEECQLQSTVDIVLYGLCDKYHPEADVCRGWECPEGQKCSVDRSNGPVCVCRTECAQPGYAPVCGSDLRTYPSRCDLALQACSSRSDVTVLVDGACPDVCAGVKCEFYAECVPVSLTASQCVCPDLQCSAHRHTVCGTDGLNYANHCTLLQNSCYNQAEVKMRHEGACLADPCDQKTCPRHAVCVSDNDYNTQCLCPSCDDQTYDPVCSDQGITYPSPCALQRAACETKDPGVTLYQRGQCPSDFFQSKCASTCKAPKKCLPDPETNQIACLCPPCDETPPSDQSPICTHVGELYPSLCDLKYASCQRQVELRITTDSSKCTRATCPAGRQVILTDLSDESYLRCSATADCPVGSICIARVCCSHGSLAPSSGGGSVKCEDSKYGCCKSNSVPALGSNYAGCPEKCECDISGSYSDMCDNRGQCLCKPGVQGKRCDTCKPFFWGFVLLKNNSRNMHRGCQKCDCDEYGTNSNLNLAQGGCDKTTGQCPCKYPAKGVRCDTCPEGQTMHFIGCAAREETVEVGSCESCMYGARCSPAPGATDSPGRCSCPLEEGCGSSTRLVCGSDGQTYKSLCTMNVSACKQQTNITALKNAPCNPDFEDACDYSPCSSSSICQSLLQSPGFVCLCPFGSEGPDCNSGAFISIPSFSSVSYVSMQYPKSSLNRLQLRLTMRGPDANHIVLLLAGNYKPTEKKSTVYLLVYVTNMIPVLRYQYEDYSVVVQLDEPAAAAANSWYNLALGVEDDSLYLESAGEKKQVVLPGGLKLPVASGDVLLSIGNVPANINSHVQASVLANLPSRKGLNGCVSNLIVDGDDIPLSYPSAMTGIFGVDIHECSESNPCGGGGGSNPCRNGATCLPVEGDEFRCLCQQGFTGVTCEQSSDPCLKSPCNELSQDADCEMISDTEFKCLCPLDILGERCEKQIRVEAEAVFVPEFNSNGFLRRLYPLPSGTNLQVQMWFLVTESSGSGLLLYCGQNADGGGDFFSIGLVAGRLEVSYDLGVSPVFIKSEQEVKPNVWHEMRFTRTGQFGQLILDDRVTSGKSAGQLTQLNLNEPMYVGGHPAFNRAYKSGQTTGLRGVIQKLWVNNMPVFGNNTVAEMNQLFDQAYHVTQFQRHTCFTDPPCQHGGTCLPNRDEYVCRCQPAFLGKRCEQRKTYILDMGYTSKAILLDGNTSLKYRNLATYEVTSQTSNSISIQFKTGQSNGQLVWIKSPGINSNNNKSDPDQRKDFLSVAISRGFLEVSVELGSGVNTIYSQERVDDEQWHTVAILRQERLLTVKVDTQDSIRSFSPEGATSLNTDGILWLGGGGEDVPPRLPANYRKQFLGCVTNLISEHKLIALVDHVLNPPRSLEFCD